VLTQAHYACLPAAGPAVTFVALGNGAPDLSANIAAISAGEVTLSAGALTGAAMFVQVRQLLRSCICVFVYDS
jgi:Ca2+/Na+ antiporter